MTSIALIFPGQGAQTVGMGKDLYDNSKEAKDIFEKAEQVIGEGFCDIIFNGPQEKLTETAYSQPAILTVSMAALAALKARESFKEMDARFAAGLSLGELSALAASGALSFEETLKLVQQRGAFMQEACRLNEGKMAAVIGLDKYKIIEKAEDLDSKVKFMIERSYGMQDAFEVTLEEDGVTIKLPEVCKYDEKWFLAKYKIISDLRDILDMYRVTFLEEYLKKQEEEGATEEAKDESTDEAKDETEKSSEDAAPEEKPVEEKPEDKSEKEESSPEPVEGEEMEEGKKEE